MRMRCARKVALLIFTLLVALLFLSPEAEDAREGAFDGGAAAFPNGAIAEGLGAIAISPETVAVGLGDRAQIDYTVDGAPNALNVEWTSSDPAIATIAPGGIVTAVSEGECFVSGVSHGGHAAEARVQVYPAPSVLIVTPSSVKIGTGERYAIRPVISAGSRASFTYQSSDTSVADVDGAGVVTAKKRGSATITVKTHNGVRDSLNITVARAPKSIRFKADELLAYTGEAVKASVALSSGSASIIAYESSDPAIVRVDSRGRITGVSAGRATITATTFNGKTAECPVVVYDPPTAIVAPPLIEAVAGVPMDVDIYAVLANGERYEGYIDIDLADPDIAVVRDGVLYPLRRGETYVTLTAHRVSTRVYVSVGRYGDAYATLVAAHRGDFTSGTENTLAAIAGAVAAGADYVEVDVRKTRDGALVLMHDATVTRTSSSSSGQVAKLTLAQLQAINFKGQPICTLEEALAYLAGTNVKILIEMKVSGIAADCAALVAQYEMQQQAVFVSFSLNTLQAVRTHMPEAQIGYLYLSGINTPVTMATQYEIDIMLPYWKLVDEPYVAALHNAGIQVGVWTVNKSSDIRAMHRTGVDIIITDYVERAFAAIIP
ncbi:MAG: glycerophosphodiester phosphodiesterase family protein [Christensenellales bacterium]